MNVRKLIKVLQGFDQDLVVYLQKDAEGNGYDDLRGLEQVAIRKDGHVIECFNLTDTADENCLEEDEWEDLKKTSKALVLAP